MSLMSAVARTGSRKECWVCIESSCGRFSIEQRYLQSLDVLKINLDDYHCRQVVFACSSKSGYARMLKKHAEDYRMLRRITLISAAPKEEHEANKLAFSSIRIDDLFRDMHPESSVPSKAGQR